MVHIIFFVEPSPLKWSSRSDNWHALLLRTLFHDIDIDTILVLVENIIWPTPQPNVHREHVQ